MSRSASEKLFRRILVPHDLSAPADEALGVAAALATEHGGRLDVVHAVGPFYPALEHTYAAQGWLDPAVLEREARDALTARVRRVLRRNAPEVRCRATVGDPLTTIVDASKKASVLVVSTAGHGDFGRLFIGSTTEKIVRHASCPVLTVRPRAARKRRGAR